jgi:hypothetical protein
VADEDHALEAQRLDHRLNVGGQAGGAPDLAALSRFTVPRLVEGDDAVISGEGLDLVLPVRAVAAPAVQEDQGRVANPSSARTVFLAGLASRSPPITAAAMTQKQQIEGAIPVSRAFMDNPS